MKWMMIEKKNKISWCDSILLYFVIVNLLIDLVVNVYIYDANKITQYINNQPNFTKDFGLQEYQQDLVVEIFLVCVLIRLVQFQKKLPKLLVCG